MQITKSIQSRVRKRRALPRLLTWLYDVAFGVIIVGGIFFFVAAFGEGGTFIDRLGKVDSLVTRSV